MLSSRAILLARGMRMLTEMRSMQEGDDGLIPSSCFAFCGSYQYAGLEFGM